MEKKICRIRSGETSYILEVDGQQIPFDTHKAVTYFAEHYKALGYELEFITTSNNKSTNDE